MVLSGELATKQVEKLGALRHGRRNCFYSIIDLYGVWSWIVCVVVKGQKKKKGASLRTDFGLGVVDIFAIIRARERAVQYGWPDRD